MFDSVNCMLQCGVCGASTLTLEFMSVNIDLALHQMHLNTHKLQHEDRGLTYTTLLHTADNVQHVHVKHI